MRSLILFSLTALIFSIVHQAWSKDETLRSGSFSGQSDHQVSGTVSIVKRGEVVYLVLADNFKFDGAPDPKIGFSKKDKFDKKSTFSRLNQDSGSQMYRLPATLDHKKYDEVTLWCDKFGVPLGEAKLK